MDLKQISRVCNTFRGRYKSVLIQSGLTRFLIILLVIGIFSAAFDWMFHFKTFARCCILLGAIGAGAFVFWWTTILALKKNWTDTQVLSYLDTTEGRDTKGILELFELIKAENIQETRTEIGKNFLEEAINDLNQRLNRLTYNNALRKSSFLKWFYGLVGILAFIAVVGVVDTERAKIGATRFFNPFSLVDWPSRTKVKVFLPNVYTITLKAKDGKSTEFKFDNVRDKNFEIAFGSDSSNGIPVVDPAIAGKQFKYVISRDEMFIEDLKTEVDTKLNGVKVEGRIPFNEKDIVTVGDYTLSMAVTEMDPWSIPQLEAVIVSAFVSGEVPSQATIIYTSKASDLQIKEKINIAKNGNIDYVFPSVKEPLTFYIKAGDYDTREFTISVIQRPFLKKITADYTYPAYAGVPNKKVESGQLTGIEGTKVVITFESSMALSKAVFNHEEVGKSDLIKVNDTTFKKELQLEKNGAYSIELYEKSGFREAKPERFEIKVDPDAKPEIDIIAPGRNLSETKNASIEIAFKATDDFGIKSLGVYYKVGEQKDFQKLSDKITGPISVGGKKSEVRFDWDFKKMEIPESSVIRYYIQAQDVNPTGNGVTKSGEYEIELIKPSVFHQEAVLKAKVLLTEAMIAWKNQLEAYKEGQAWLPKAENKVDDALWQGMVDKQDAAIRAVDAMNSHLAILTDKFERNRMQREFMAVRLNSIIVDIKAMTSKEMGVVDSKIREAKPKNDAEAGRIKEIRTAALKSFEANQKMSVLYMERILRKLFDWRDLQDCTIKTTDIYERQMVILERTVELAPRLIGKDVLDLSDEDQTSLTDLAKQQKSIYEAETSTEQLLVYLMARAKINKRESIQKPLDTAFKYLRSQRVNDSLKRIDQLISDNQCSMVTGDQKKVAEVMSVVKGGLVKAGMDVEPDQPLKGNIELAKAEDFEEPKEEKKEDKKPTTVATPEVKEEEEPKNEDDMLGKLKELVPGEDAVSTAIMYAIDIQDKIRARLKYLSTIKDPKTMPRFRKMKIKRMEELQAGAVESIIEKAIEISEKEKKDFVAKELKRIKAYSIESSKLITAKDISETHQLFLEANMSHLNNLVLLIAKEKDINGIVDEHTRQGGKDSFGRVYLAQEADLKSLSESSIDLFKAYIFESYITHTTSRFEKNPAESAELKAVEAKIRNDISGFQNDVKVAIDSEKVKSEKLTDLVKEKYKSYDGYKAFAADLAKIAEAIKSGKDDPLAARESKEFTGNLASFVSSLKDLMDERVKEVVVVIEEPTVVITAEDFENMQKPEYIKKLIEKSNMPSDQKQVLLRSLNTEFKGKYKDLLAAYFRTLAEEAGAQR